jgi:hypothetical protein
VRKRARREDGRREEETLHSTEIPSSPPPPSPPSQYPRVKESRGVQMKEGKRRDILPKMRVERSFKE